MIVILDAPIDLKTGATLPCHQPLAFARRIL
jgi:hypothetical protein